MKTWLLLAFCVALLQGCAVVSVAGAVAGAAIDVGGAVISTTVKVTGKAAGAAIDAISAEPAKPAP